MSGECPFQWSTETILSTAAALRYRIRRTADTGRMLARLCGGSHSHWFWKLLFTHYVRIHYSQWASDIEKQSTAIQWLQSHHSMCVLWSATAWMPLATNKGSPLTSLWKIIDHSCTLFSVTTHNSYNYSIIVCTWKLSHRFYYPFTLLIANWFQLSQTGQ